VQVEVHMQLKQIRSTFSQFSKFLKGNKKYLYVHLAIFAFAVVWVSLQFIFTIMKLQYSNDFGEYYSTALVFFGKDPSLIYNYSYMFTNYQANPFRSLLAVLGYFYLYTKLPWLPSYIIYSIVALFINLSTLFITAKALALVEPPASEGSAPSMKYKKYLVAFFILPFFLEVYLQGQVAMYVAFFVISGLYCCLKGHEFAGSVLLGLSIVFKPVAIFVVLFLVLEVDPKKIFRRIIGIAITLVPDALIFLTHPSLLSSFISLNISGYRGLATFFPAISFSQFLIQFANVGPLQAQLVALAIALVIGLLLRYRLRNKDERVKLIFAFTYGILLYTFVESDVWASHLVFLYPMLVLLCPFIEGRYRKNLIFYFFCLYPLVCEIGFPQYSLFIPDGVVLDVTLRLIICAGTVILFAIVVRFFYDTQAGLYQLQLSFVKQ
jgi:hypothetical protein